jgi:hypothetical protein
MTKPKEKRPSGGKSAGASSAKNANKASHQSSQSDYSPKPGEWKPPALEAYITRLGAVERNFLRWVVKEAVDTKYHRDVAVIDISPDGIKCSSAAHAPTKDELKAINAELNKIKEWPTSRAVNDTHALQRLIKQKFSRDKPLLFEFKDAEGLVVFVQERVLDDGGGKTDYPWSYWGPDIGWQMMEPSGLLPLFGLDQLKTNYSIFIHEGAKTAQYLQWMTGESSYAAGVGLEEHPWLEKCPWRTELRNAAHIGWPGGAPNPHRVDWSPIKKLPPRRIILVCDHDSPGENAARENLS